MPSRRLFSRYLISPQFTSLYSHYKLVTNYGLLNIELASLRLVRRLASLRYHSAFSYFFSFPLQDRGAHLYPRSGLATHISFSTHNGGRHGLPGNYRGYRTARGQPARHLARSHRDARGKLRADATAFSIVIFRRITCRSWRL